MQDTHIARLIHQIAFQEDERSFEQLFLHFYDHLYRFAYHHLHVKEAAEEVVMDVFLAIWQKRKSLDKIQNVKVYLYVAVKNHSINYQKKHKKGPFIPATDRQMHQINLPDTPESELLSQELKKEIDEAIEQLPARCRLIFEMIRIDGLKYKEVAEVLDISVKTVEAQIKIALQKLGTRLAHHLHEHNHQHIIKSGAEAILALSLSWLSLLQIFYC